MYANSGVTMKLFKPQLFPNDQVKITDMPDKEYLSSTKYDGVRCIFRHGEMLSRSLKRIPNKQLHDKFKHIKDISEESGITFDGELYAHNLSFQEITSIVMTHNKDVPTELEFFCFDSFDDNFPLMKFQDRLEVLPENELYVTVVKQNMVKKDQLLRLMKQALENGYEGLIIRDPMSIYKFGRVTVKSGDGFKMKPYRTFDAQIIGFVQATVVRERAEKKINELGNSETSKKKADRVPVNKVAAFLVHYNGKELKVVYAASDKEKEKAWNNRFNLHGKWIEYKGMLLGAKDLPRHPVFQRFRGDK